MKFISSVKQCEGPGGTLEKWLLDNGLILKYSKDQNYYHIFIDDKKHNCYTKYIYDKISVPYNEIVMELTFFMSYSIKIEHKHFDKFIQIIEKLSIEDLVPDPFSG